MTWHAQERELSFTIDGDEVRGTVCDENDVRFDLVHRANGVVELDVWTYDGDGREGPHIAGHVTRADLAALLAAYPDGAA